MGRVMARFFWGMFWFVLFCATMAGVKCWGDWGKKVEHDALTKGCVMTGTIQGYRVGRGSMPAQEQWSCNGMMRTVNAI